MRVAEENTRTSGRDGFFIRCVKKGIDKKRRKEIAKDFYYRLSVRRKCKLLKISRSSIYYKDKGEREENQILMELIDKKYQHDPTYGARRMQKYLPKRHGYKVNLKRVRRLKKRCRLKEFLSFSLYTYAPVFKIFPHHRI